MEQTRQKRTAKILIVAVLTFVVTLAMVVGLMPGMGLTAYATPTETLLTTITATGQEQASYSVENIATVSFSYTAQGSSAYFNNGKTNWGWWGYGWIATVSPVDGYTITKCVFYDDQDRTATDSEAPFVVETTEEDKTPQVNGTPILAYTSKGITKIEVYGYVTPSVVSTVTLNTNGGIINAGNVTEYTEGTGATLPTDVTKNNYTFGGWYDNSELTGDAMEAISPSETGDKTYWAKWTMNGDQQIFVKLRDGATKTVNVDMTDTIAVVKQKASDLFECAYEKMFLIFAGKLLGDDTKTLEQCNIQKEATLHLIVGYFVTFESNGGSAVAGKPVSENATMVAPDEPTKAEHTFVGWYTEPALTNAWDFDNDTVTEDITLYAKWTENPNITELTFSGYNGDYDTNGHGAVVTGDTSNYTIRYSTDGVEYTLEQTPTYTAVSQHTIYYQVTRDGYKTLTGSVEIVIGKATPSYTVPTDLVATYGDTLSSISLPDGWAWADNTASVGNAGTNTFKANFTPADTANYNTVNNVDVTVSVVKADPTYTIPSGLTATYGDTLSSVTLPEGWTWTEPTTSVGTVGSHTFAATFTPDNTDNYDIVKENLTVTVNANDKSALIAAIGSASEYYNSISSEHPDIAATLQNAIDVATSVKNDDNKTEAEISDAVTALNSALDQAKADENQAKASIVKALIAAIGEVAYTTESKGKIDEARAAYNGLTADQKALVDTYETLTTAESNYNTLKADNDAADEVKALIAAIGEVAYTTESKGKIDEARTAYNGLTADQKALVDTYETLTTAETTYATEKKTAEDNAAANAVKEKIAAIGTVEYTTESKDKIDEAKAAYDTLTADQKALVDTYETFTTAESTYNTLKANNEAADEVKALIDSIGTVELTVNSKAVIDLARESYDGLTAEQKALVSNYAVLTAAEVRYTDLGAADEVKTLVDAIGDVTYSTESKDKIDAAREAYDALTADQKALVTNYGTLTSAEGNYTDLKAVKEAEDAVSVLPASDDITVTDKAAVAAAKAKCDALTPAQKATVSAETVAKLSAASNMVAAQEVVVSIGNIDADNPDSAKVTEARAAYDALTDEQKAKITNYETLTAAEAKLAELNNKGLGAGFIVLMVMLCVIVAACIVLLVLYTLDKKGKLKRKDE